MAVFDRHLIASIEAMLGELTQEQQRIFTEIMGTIKFNPKRTYGANYYRFLGEMGIEFDPNLYGHPLSRLVYIHELRHVVDDIKSGLPPQGMTVDTLTTESAALDEGYHYLSLVNNDPDYDISRYPKNSVKPERLPDEDDVTWAKRNYDDALGVDMNAVRKLSREDYIKLTLKHYEEKEKAQAPYSLWGELLKYASEKAAREKESPH